jgi:metallo-beta-lactamase family protein
LLYLLAEHYAEFLDSPMAIAASRVYWRNPGRFDEEAARLRGSFHGLPPLPNLVLCETGDDSRAINNVRGGAIVIAGSGMANGGRVLHHLRHNLPRPECHVVIVGFQAPGYLVHGEPSAADSLAVKLHARGTSVTVARPGLKVDLASLNSLAGDRSIP